MQIHRNLLQAFKANADHLADMFSDMKLQQLQKVGTLTTEQLTAMQTHVNVLNEIENNILTQIENNIK